jgi:hypothetical protein
MPNPFTLSGVEVQSSTAKALMDALGLLSQETRRILAQHGIPTLVQQEWYPIETLLGCLRDIRSQMGPYTLHSLGRLSAQHIAFLPTVGSFPVALASLHEAYQTRHRGQENLGGYHAESHGGRAARIRCDNPYPCEFDQGLLESLFERFPPQEAFRLRCAHVPDGCRTQGAPACLYHLQW